MKELPDRSPVCSRIAEEKNVQQKVEEDGSKWTKVYFGGGAHFKNWLSQFIELYGEENVKAEEADPTGFQCFEESGEKMFRVWVRSNVESFKNTLTGNY